MAKPVLIAPSILSADFSKLGAEIAATGEEMGGEGMPQLRRPERRGALRVVINVVIPRRLTDQQRSLNQQLADSLTEENMAAPEGLGAKLRRLLSSGR